VLERELEESGDRERRRRQPRRLVQARPAKRASDGAEDRAQDEERHAGADRVEHADHRVQERQPPALGSAHDPGIDHEHDGQEQQHDGAGGDQPAGQSAGAGLRRRMHRPKYIGQSAHGNRSARNVAMQAARILVILAGLASIAGLVAVTGVGNLLMPVQALSWRIAVVLLVPYAAVAVLDTVAWRLVFMATPVALRDLFLVRLAGEALNLGTASVGGEPLKAYLLRPAVPLVEASAAVVVDKTTITVGQVLFLALGLGIALPWFDLSPEFRWAMGALLGIQVLAVAGFVLVQVVGIVRWMRPLLGRLGLRNDSPAQGLIRFEGALAGSYRERPGRILASIVVHLLAWVVGSLEVYLVLWWLQVDASLAGAFVIDAFGTGVKFMAFAIPGALGALEGGFMLVFSALGLGSGLGLSFTLIRRLRMLAWGGLGLVVLALLGRRRTG
jgi:uncharacterized protein (TIRG00374 family)